MVTLRRLTTDDAALLSGIGGKSLIESHGHSAPAPVVQAYVDKAFSLAACRAELADAANIFTAAFWNGQPAGYSKISLACAHPAVALQPVTKLERLYLLKAFYDHKLGHRLLNEARSFSAAHGDVGMWLNVWKENDRAFEFYQRQGFEIVGESDFWLTAEHANPNWVMLLRY